MKKVLSDIMLCSAYYVLSDPHMLHRKRKVREIEEHNRPGGVDKWKIRGSQSWKRAKQRRH